ncbi:testosterone 17-beta-dehydrogenase 3-like, partial [Clarias magur]
ITGGSEGIGKAYAEEFARLGLNVVIISRSKEKLDRVARKLENKMDRNVMVIVADFTKDDMDGHIKENIQDLEVAVLVNNVGMLPSFLPNKFLDTVHLEEKIYQMINCNVKAMVKMCRIVLPGMVERGQGIILNISSGISKTPCPMYTLYSSTKAVSPFGVSTAMSGFQKPSMITLTPEEFVRSSLRYLKAGDQTYGSVSHAVL